MMVLPALTTRDVENDYGSTTTDITRCGSLPGTICVAGALFGAEQDALQCKCSLGVGKYDVIKLP